MKKRTPISITIRCGKKTMTQFKARLPADEAMTWYFLAAGNDLKRFWADHIELATKKPSAIQPDDLKRGRPLPRGRRGRVI